MTERVLVTGGAGYIGGVVVAQLLQRAYDVVVLDDLSNGCRAAVPEGARLAVGDVGDRAALDRLFREYSFDAVMHFAAFIEAGESMKFPAKYFRHNTANALTLLDAVTTHKVPRFVFSSTAALFGGPERTPIEETYKRPPPAIAPDFADAAGGIRAAQGTFDLSHGLSGRGRDLRAGLCARFRSG